MGSGPNTGSKSVGPVIAASPESEFEFLSFTESPDIGNEGDIRMSDTDVPVVSRIH